MPNILLYPLSLVGPWHLGELYSYSFILLSSLPASYTHSTKNRLHIVLPSLSGSTNKSISFKNTICCLYRSFHYRFQTNYRFPSIIFVTKTDFPYILLILIRPDSPNFLIDLNFYCFTTTKL